MARKFVEEEVKNTAAVDALAKWREEHAGEEMVKTNPVEKFLKNPKALRAIKMFCWECNGYNRGLTKGCENGECPLWLFRSGSANRDEDDISKFKTAYRNHMQDVGELNAVDDGPDDGDDNE